LKEIDFSLMRKMPKETFSFRNVAITINGDKASMTFKP
jgi:hypothetical protein